MLRTCFLAFALSVASAASNAAILDFESYNAGDSVGLIDLGGGVTVTVFGEGNTQGGVNNAAMVFDTDSPTGGDNDLAASFTLDTGSGQQIGGTLEPGNVLILSEDDDNLDPDDDARGGLFTFTFSTLVNIESILLLDDIRATFLTAKGSTSESITSDNEYKVKSFAGNADFMGISVFQVRLSDSGAIDELEFTVVPVPAALPLLIGSLGALGFVSRSRRKPA